jgi:hypothetical protein
MANIVTGDEYFALDGQLGEIKRQIRQPLGYPYSVAELRVALHDIIMGHFSSKPWQEENGVITFSVTTDGTTGEGWKERLEGKGFLFGGDSKGVLCSPHFKPSNGVTTEVRVLRGSVFCDYDRVSRIIRGEAGNRKFSKSKAELACLIREKFTDEDFEAMGLQKIVTMHEPINVDGGSFLLGAVRGGWLTTWDGGSSSAWPRGVGFAFTASEAVTF